MTLITKENDKTICVISPFPPPYGGMAVQAERLVSKIRGEGWAVIPIETNPDLSNSLKVFSNVRGLRTVIRTFIFLKNLYRALPQVDVVYFLTGFFSFFFWVTYPALILIILFRKKVILSAHGGGAQLFFKKYGYLIRPVVNSVDAVSVPSGFLRSAFKSSFNIDAKIIPNTIDFGKFQYRERASVQPRILVTRSLEKIYNVGCVIRAFKIIHDQYPQSILGVVGDGSQREHLQNAVEAFGLKDFVVFYGRVNHSRIQELYNSYDIYINASNVDNLPLVILEAFASGLPVVTTNAGGIPYIVEDGVTGLLADKDDSRGLAELVIKLLKEPEKALRLAQNARKESQKYSWENVRPLLFSLLEE
jgi:glycosyltransferase involved in cell wall biosynthesis